MQLRSCLKRKNEVEFDPFNEEPGVNDEDFLYGSGYTEQHRHIIEESNNCGLQDTQ